MASNFEIDQPINSPNNSITQAFPGFKTNSFTFAASLIQFIFYLISLILSESLIEPSFCSLYNLGANYVPSIIEDKQFYRLFTAIFLHGSAMHLLVIFIQINIFAQLRLGFTIEKYYGLKKYIFIYILSGIGGNLLGGFIRPTDITVGASTSLFGVFGCYGCYFVYNWNTLGPGRNLNLVLYLFFVLISLELPITLQSIDIGGHIGGFIVGILLGFFLLPREENSDTWNYVLIINGMALLGYFAFMIWSWSQLEITDRFTC
ncbi:hypothetical protein SteCoe_3843 [Stentor coeruleus]|uniref:Rhomboid-like protease n=1 Tax=Stentor coeruleus TaxID=5963 RepID=A0A1R2CWB3_9CILI|nr:hypothetical protein SteCoe_3843 [Stentor coeruleus]